MNKNFECIITIVNSDFSEEVIEASRNAGAKGATLINARGSTSKPNKFFKLNIEQDKQIILILCKHSQTKKIVDSISEKTGLNTKGSSVSFVLPVEDAIGMATIFKESEENA